MDESERLGVQHLAWHGVACRVGQFARSSATIDRVAGQWTAKMLKMYADLVCAPRVQFSLLRLVLLVPGNGFPRRGHLSRWPFSCGAPGDVQWAP